MIRLFLALLFALSLCGQANAIDWSGLSLLLMREQATNATWTDLGPNGLHAYQGNSSFQPSVTADGVLFDGTNDYFQTAATTGIPTGNASFTIITRHRWNGVANSVLLGTYRFGTWANTSISIEPVFTYYSNTPYVGRFVGGEYFYGAGTSTASGSWQTIAISHDGAGAIVYQDGVKIGNASHTFNLVADGNAIRIGTVDPNDGYHGYWAGEISDVIVFSRALGASEIEEIDIWLETNRQYGPATRTVRFAAGSKINLYSNLQKPQYLTSLCRHDYSDNSASTYDTIRKVNWTTTNSYMSNQAYVWNPELLPATYSGRLSGAKAAGSNNNVESACYTSYDPNIHPGSDDFSIDFWIWYIGGATNTSTRYTLYSQSHPTDAGTWWALKQGGGTFDGGTGGCLYFEVASSGSLIANEYAANSLNPDNIWGIQPLAAHAWHHIEVSRTGGELRFFVDGTLKTKFYGQQLGTKTVPACNGANIYMWKTTLSSTPYFLIDEFRFQKGGGGHTSNFTPSNVPAGQPLTAYIHKAIDGFLSYK